MIRFLVLLLLLTAGQASAAESGLQSDKAAKPDKWTTARICDRIQASAGAWDVPRVYFARLIWTESRFDINARSPVGAQGIAQFMPATAKARGLNNPYEPASALLASASLLAFHHRQFGNWGRAAAAYNAGPNRVSKWLAGKSGLPFETLNYITAVTGKPASYFKPREAKLGDIQLHKGKSFQDACRALPILKTRFKGIASAPRLPWGVQVAANFSRNKAMHSWLRVRPKLGLVTGSSKPNLHRIRTLRGLKSKWAVRLGAKSRGQAQKLCRKIQSVGGFCIVKRN